MKKKNWILPDEGIIENFFKSRGIPAEKIDYFLNFSEKDLRKDYLDMDKVVKRIAEAVENSEHIVIYGDYDCDGITATSIILLALRNIGVTANFFINNRFSEGYGMNEKGVSRLVSEFPDTDLIVTCDNGIAAQVGIKYALDNGIDVVCTDHHLQKGDIIVPTVDEWRDDEDENAREECCGAEIARRTMLRLYEYLGKDTSYIEKLITFSSIATVADVVRFTAANRYLVRKGLEYLNDPQFPIISLIKQLMSVKYVDEESLGFRFGPLMNCLSRVTGEPDDMVRILTSEKNDMKTYNLVKHAVQINEKRRRLTMQQTAVAEAAISEDDSCIVAAGDYAPGIAGLICSDLVEKYNRPVICLCDQGDGLLKGSARSYLDFHLKNALDKCEDLLVAYGGHAGAAGLTLKKENLEKFRERICGLVTDSGVIEKEPELRIDYECTVSDLADDTVEKLLSFGPFGQGFERPRIAYKGNFKRVTFMPKDDPDPKHVSFVLDDRIDNVKVVWFNGCHDWNDLDFNKKEEIEVVGSPRIEEYNGKESRQILLEEVRQTASA